MTDTLRHRIAYSRMVDKDYHRHGLGADGEHREMFERHLFIEIAHGLGREIVEKVGMVKTEREGRILEFSAEAYVFTKDALAELIAGEHRDIMRLVKEAEERGRIKGINEMAATLSTAVRESLL